MSHNQTCLHADVKRLVWEKLKLRSKVSGKCDGEVVDVMVYLLNFVIKAQIPVSVCFSLVRTRLKQTKVAQSNGVRCGGAKVEMKEQTS